MVGIKDTDQKYSLQILRDGQLTDQIDRSNSCSLQYWKMLATYYPWQYEGWCLVCKLEYWENLRSYVKVA